MNRIAFIDQLAKAGIIPFEFDEDEIQEEFGGALPLLQAEP